MPTTEKQQAELIDNPLLANLLKNLDVGQQLALLIVSSLQKNPDSLSQANKIELTKNPNQASKELKEIEKLITQPPLVFLLNQNHYLGITGLISEKPKLQQAQEQGLSKLADNPVLIPSKLEYPIEIEETANFLATNLKIPEPVLRMWLIKQYLSEEISSKQTDLILLTNPQEILRERLAKIISTTSARSETERYIYPHEDAPYGGVSRSLNTTLYKQQLGKAMLSFFSEYKLTLQKWDIQHSFADTYREAKNYRGETTSFYFQCSHEQNSFLERTKQIK